MKGTRDKKYRILSISDHGVNSYFFYSRLVISAFPRCVRSPLLYRIAELFHISQKSSCYQDRG